MEDGHIHANATVLYIRYIKRVTDPNVYDLCSSTLPPLPGRRDVRGVHPKHPEEAGAVRGILDSITRAKRVDAQENPPAEFEEDEWVLARY